MTSISGTQPEVLAPPARHGAAVEHSVTVIVPVNGQIENLAELYREYAAPLREHGRDFEFVFIASPNSAASIPLLEPLVAAGEPIRALVAQTMSEATLFRTGASIARGEVFITLPPFRRVEAPALVELLHQVDQGLDFVVARRWPRRDPWVNRLQTWVFHRLTKSLRREQLNDVASGVQAMRREVIADLPLYGDLFRFLPILALGAGFSVAEVDATQHPADRLARLYRPGVYFRRLLDVMGLFFLVRFTDKPLRFFGLVGASSLFVGSAVLFLIFVERLFGKGVADRPLMIIGVLLIVLGVQAVGLGLVGEIIVHLHIRRTRRYRVIGTGEPVPMSGQPAAAGEKGHPVGVEENGARSAPMP